MDEQELKNQIGRIVDDWVSNVVRSQFMQKPQNATKTSLWDRLKQGVSNLWWGSDNNKNTYRWRNRFGDELGVSESFDPTVFSLKEYADIKGVVDRLEHVLVESDEEFNNLRLMKLITGAAERLKEMLFQALKDNLNPSGSAPPKATPAPEEPAPEPPPRTARATAPVEEPPRGKPSEPDADDPIQTRKSPKRSAKKDSSEKPADKAKSGGEAETSSTADSGSGGDGSGSEDSKRGDQTDSQDPPVENENETLRGFLFDGNEPRPAKETAEVLFDFVKKLRDRVDASRKSEVKDWWRKVVGEISGKTAQQIRETFLFNLVRTSRYVGAIAAAARLDAEEVKRMMEDHLKGSGDDKGKEEKEIPKDSSDNAKDESLGMEAYLFTDGKPDYDSAIRRIEGFLKNPLAILGVSIDEDRAKKLSEWWSSEKEKLEGMTDAFEHLNKSLVGTEEYIDQISKALGKGKDLTKNMMVKHIQKNSNR